MSKTKKINRAEAANKAVSTMAAKTSLTELVEIANNLVVESGGESKPKETAWHVKRVLNTAESLGVVKLTRPTDITVERVKK